MLKSPTAFLKLFFTIFALFGLLFLGIGVGVTVADPGEPLFLLCFGLMGLLFFLCGAIGLLVLARKARRRRWLLEHGRMLYAQLDGIGRSTSVELNGRRPYVVDCHYVDASTRTVYQFHSELLGFDPTPMLEGRDTVKVFVDPDDYRRYVVDPDSLTNGFRVIN